MAQIGASGSVAVHMLGKVKTTVQMIAIPFLLYHGMLFGVIDTQLWGTVLIVVAAVLLGWLTFRAWHARKKIVKWVGVIVSGLFAIILALLSVLMLVGMVKVYPLRSAPVPDLSVAGTPQQVERGRHLANSFCASCHSPTNELPLTGGRDLGKDFPMPLGTFVSANLTPAGPASTWSDGELFRAIRIGAPRIGHRTLIDNAIGMPTGSGPRAGG